MKDKFGIKGWWRGVTLNCWLIQNSSAGKKKQQTVDLRFKNLICIFKTDKTEHEQLKLLFKVWIWICWRHVLQIKHVSFLKGSSKRRTVSSDTLNRNSTPMIWSLHKAVWKWSWRPRSCKQRHLWIIHYLSRAFFHMQSCSTGFGWGGYICPSHPVCVVLYACVCVCVLLPHRLCAIFIAIALAYTCTNISLKRSRTMQMSSNQLHRAPGHATDTQNAIHRLGQETFISPPSAVPAIHHAKVIHSCWPH